jgi:acyl-coenzyme A synthetase/AMP-(fatty) acid ligase
MNILDPIRRNSQAFPGRIALVTDGKEVTYGQLARLTGLAGARLAEAGVASGESVALSVSHPASYLLTALAVARLGAVVTPLNLSSPAEQTSAIIEHHQIRTVVRDFREEWRHPSVPEGRYLSAKSLLGPAAAGTGANMKLPELAMDVGGQPWLIALSSGTTGKRKSIVQTHERAVLYACLANEQSDPADMERVLVFASPHLSISINAILQQLVAGRTVVLSTGSKPEHFFASIARDRPTRVVATTGTAVRLVAYAAQSLPDSRSQCESVRSMTIGGSAASPSLCEQIERFICPRLEIYYGSSEAGRIATATRETLTAQPSSAGRLCPWVEMEAVDESGQALPPGTSGVLRVRSPLMAEGYLHDPEATARAYRDGWYYPGDTGSVDKTGYLTLNGRVDEVLNLGGNKMDPFIIEAVLDAQPHIEESVVLAVQDARGFPLLIALVVASAPFDEQALRKACLERLGPNYVPRRIRRTDSIPRNSGGKVMRKELAERVSRLAPKIEPALKGK